METPDFDKTIVICHEEKYYGLKYEYFDAGDWSYYYTTEDGNVIIYRRNPQSYSKETRELDIKWWAYFEDICKNYESMNGDVCSDMR